MAFIDIQNQVAQLFLAKDDSPANHLAIAKEFNRGGDIPPYFRKLRVAFLSNFTLQGLPEIFRVRAIFHNIWAETYLAPYNQYAQEILNKESGLNKFKPELVYFLMDFFDSDSKQVDELTETVKSNLKAELLVVSNFGDFKAHWYTKYKDLGDMRLAPDAFPALSDKLMKDAVAVSGATKKCLVMDLDNTLWKGVVGEDGFDGIQPDVELQKHILSLYERGVILAINSKNNLEDALEVFERHQAMVLRKNHLAAWRINWGDKAKNLAELAEELNLGLDSFVFIDDDQFQLARVRDAFPEVAAICPDQLKDYPGFHSAYLTEEDKRRGAMYAEEQSRRELKSSLASVNDFLRQLSLGVTFKKVDESSLARVAQLIQKTNQFNLATRRYSEGDLRNLLKLGWGIWTVQAADRFGDYGVIGVAMAEPKAGEWRIDNFLLSCRILGRGIETAFLHFLAEGARTDGASRIIGEFIPTAKNKLCATFYQDNGFLTSQSDERMSVYELPLENYKKTYPDFIKVQKVQLV